MTLVKAKAPYDLQVEHYHGDVLAIRTATPRLSWKYDGHVADSDEVELEITRHMPGQKGTTETITTEPVNNVLFQWPLEPLVSREQVEVKARLFDGDTKGGWSTTLKFDEGILEYWELQSSFVGPSWPDENTDHRHLPLVRNEFTLKDQPVYARHIFRPWDLLRAM